MPLSKTNKDWLKIVGSKLAEYAGIALLIWGYWLPKNKELMNEEATKAIDTYNKINNKSTKSFRQTFSEGTDIKIGSVINEVLIHNLSCMLLIPNSREKKERSPVITANVAK